MIKRTFILTVSFKVLTLTLSFFGLGIAQWVRLPVPEDVHMLLSTYFVNEKHGVAGGWGNFGIFNGKVIYTTNSGKIWQHAQLPESTRACVSIYFPDTLKGYLAGAYNTSGNGVQSAKSFFPRSHTLQEWIRWSRYARLGVSLGNSVSYRGFFMRTDDGGIHWYPRGTLPDYVTYLIGTYFIDTTIGFVTFDAQDLRFSGILKTTNGGISWTECLRINSFSALQNISFLDSLEGFAVGSKLVDTATRQGLIVHTTNGGVTWEEITFPFVQFIDLSFTTKSVGYILGVSLDSLYSFVLKTTNKGKTWTRTLQLDSVYLHGIRFLTGTDFGMVFGEKASADSFNLLFTPFVSVTKNGGSTWIKSITDSVPSFNLLLNGQLVNENLGFICGGSGFRPALILQTTNGGILFAENDHKKIVSQYRLSHNYPNPFNPTTEIQFSLPQASYVTLKIYNLLGEEVETLVSEQLSAGTYTRKWSAEKFASGVYYYRLQTDKFIETKKLLFIR